MANVQLNVFSSLIPHTTCNFFTRYKYSIPVSTLIDKQVNDLDSRDKFISRFKDLSKAFNIVQYNILKLEDYNI